MQFSNLKIYQPDGTFRTGSLAVADDRILAAGETGDAVDMDGLYAIPGLVDLHFHGCMGRDFCDGTAEAISTLAAYQAQNGVAAICPATMTYPEEKLTQIAQAAAAWSAQPHEAALVGINMEGIFSKAIYNTTNRFQISYLVFFCCLLIKIYTDVYNFFCVLLRIFWNSLNINYCFRNCIFFRGCIATP